MKKLKVHVEYNIQSMQYKYIVFINKKKYITGYIHESFSTPKKEIIEKIKNMYSFLLK